MRFLALIFIFIGIASCSEQASERADVSDDQQHTHTQPTANRQLSEPFKQYWYDGTAEISSYNLSQSRYGEQRQGAAVMIFVTEPFDTIDQVKADRPSDQNQSVLKLNATRNFTTGIYPYSIMSSTFLPLEREHNALKVASSIQEWCGQTYMQMNQKEGSYEVMLHSYFQSEGNRSFEIDNAVTENQIPAQLRLGPSLMPTGNISVIPSTEFLRLMHLETRPYQALASLEETEEFYSYHLDYPELQRKLLFITQKDFPYKILSWSDEYLGGRQPVISTATLNNSIKSAYWNKNANKYSVLRDSLAL